MSSVPSDPVPDSGFMQGMRRSVPVWFTVGAVAALLAIQLLLPPVIGLANNGDFERVMGDVGIRYVMESRDNYFSWVVTKFALGELSWFRSGLIATETFLAGIARSISKLYSTEVFDLRVLGAVHGLLLVTGVGLLVSAASALGRPSQWLVGGLIAFIFTDVGYVAPLNSFYTQAASLVFLLLTLGVAAGGISTGRFSTPRILAYFCLAALFVCSKPQESIQGPILAGLGLYLGDVPIRRPWRRLAFWAALGLCALSFWYYRQTPAQIGDVARYHKVFMELLKNSRDPQRDLADLDLDPAWAVHVGKTAYKPTSPFNDPTFLSAFLSRFSYSKLLYFYATHPTHLVSAIRRGGTSALQLRHPRFGNLEKSRGRPPSTQATAFSAWSQARTSLPGHPLLWVLLLFGGTAVAIVTTYKTASKAGKRARVSLFVIILMATSAFAVCVLANAHGDLPRHFYVFHALTDLVLLADLAWVFNHFVSRTEESLICPRCLVRSI